MYQKDEQWKPNDRLQLEVTGPLRELANEALLGKTVSFVISGQGVGNGHKHFYASNVRLVLNVKKIEPVAFLTDEQKAADDKGGTLATIPEMSAPLMPESEAPVVVVSPPTTGGLPIVPVPQPVSPPVVTPEPKPEPVAPPPSVPNIGMETGDDGSEHEMDPESPYVSPNAGNSSGSSDNGGDGREYPSESDA